MSTRTAPAQLRLVLRVPDLDGALALYRDALGMPVELDITTPTTGASTADAPRVVVLTAGRATLELVNEGQHALIDRIEVGRASAGEVRLAIEVADAQAAADAARAAGAAEIAPPTATPWGSLNARLAPPAGPHLTLFQQITPE